MAVENETFVGGVLGYVDPYATYTRIMERMPGLPIDDFNAILERRGLDKLGTEMRDP